MYFNWRMSVPSIVIYFNLNHTTEALMGVEV